MDFKRISLAVIIFASVDLLFTAITVQSASPSEAIGALRPLGSIAPKIAQLVAVGVLVGIASIIVFRRINLDLALTAVIFTPLLDIDHLPIVLGIAQPIRPAHSFVFMSVVALAIYIASKRIDISFIAVSSTMMHIVADTGQFPFLSPLSLEFYRLNNSANLMLLVGALSTALLAGYTARLTKRPVSKRIATEISSDALGVS